MLSLLHVCDHEYKRTAPMQRLHVPYASERARVCVCARILSFWFREVIWDSALIEPSLRTCLPTKRH